MIQRPGQGLTGRAATLLGVVAGCLLWGLGLAQASAAAEPAAYADVWGPSVGSQLPLLDAVDQSGQPRQLANLAGDQGLLLFLVRSADW